MKIKRTLTGCNRFCGPPYMISLFFNEILIFKSYTFLQKIH